MDTLSRHPDTGWRANGWLDLALTIRLNLVEPGDAVLVPNPSYPIHPYGFVIAGADIRHVPIVPGGDFFAELVSAIKNSWPKPKMLILNFPGNPTTQCVELDFFKEVIAIALRCPFIAVTTTETIGAGHDDLVIAVGRVDPVDPEREGGGIVQPVQTRAVRHTDQIVAAVEGETLSDRGRHQVVGIHRALRHGVVAVAA